MHRRASSPGGAAANFSAANLDDATAERADVRDAVLAACEAAIELRLDSNALTHIPARGSVDWWQ